MKRSILLAVWALLASISSAALATDYFVDARNGDDSASGLTPAEAWRSLERVNKAQYEPGDVIKFRCGCVWRGRLVTRSGSQDAPLVYTDYAVGNETVPPRIMNSADLSAESAWTLVDDSDPNLKLWATVPPRFVFLEEPAEFVNAFAQGGWHIYAEEDAKANFKKTRFDDLQKDGYALECVEPGTKRTYLQLTTQGFSVRAGHDVVFRFKARASEPCDLGSAVSVMMTNKPWSSYADTRSCKLDVTTEWKEFEVLFHTTADAEDGRLTFFIGDTLPKGVKLDFVPLPATEIKTAEGFDLKIDVGNIVMTKKCVEADPAEKVFAPTCDKQEFCAFKRWTRDELKANYDFWYDPASHRVFMFAPDNPGKLYDSVEAPLRENTCSAGGHDVVIENITFSHTGSHGISLPKTKRAVVRNCAFDWIGGGDLSGPDKRVRYGNGVEFWDGSEDCVVEKCRFSRVYDVAITTQGPELDVSKNLVMRDNLMYRCEQAFEIWFTNPKTVVEGLVFEHNLCVDCGRDWSHIQRPNKISTPILGYGLDAKTVDITIRKNVFCESAQFFIKCWHDRIGEYKIDDNVYWIDASKKHESDDKYFCYDAGHGKAPMTFDEFRAATGHDQRSRWIEPKFKDYAADDFTLLNSAELDAGPRDVDWRPLW